MKGIDLTIRSETKSIDEFCVDKGQLWSFDNNDVIYTELSIFSLDKFISGRFKDKLVDQRCGIQLIEDEGVYILFEGDRAMVYNSKRMQGYENESKGPEEVVALLYIKCKNSSYVYYSGDISYLKKFFTPQAFLKDGFSLDFEMGHRAYELAGHILQSRCDNSWTFASNMRVIE